MRVPGFLLLLSLAAGPAWGQTTEQPAEIDWPGYSPYRTLNAGAVLSPEGLVAPDGQVFLPEGIGFPADLDPIPAGRPVTLYWHESRPEDRYHRPQVQLVGEGWLQEEWLVAGRTFLLHGTDAPEVTLRLKAAEREARQAGRGIWAAGFPRCHAAAIAALGKYSVIQGRVLDVGAVNGQTFLNFGADRQSDFTVRIEDRDRRRFGGREGLATLEGRLIEARGFLYRWGGAMMDLYRSDDLEVLDDSSEYRLADCP